MANTYERFKGKNRTSDYDLETISPEEKSVCDDGWHVDDAITDSPGEKHSKKLVHVVPKI